jgi:integrase
VTWKKLVENPAEGVELPRLKGKAKRKKWALTKEQAGALIGKIGPLKPRTMVALAITAGLRRGELLAARWKYLDGDASKIAVKEAAYRGHIDTPKTEKGERTESLHPWMLDLLMKWHGRSKHRQPEDFIFSTRTGKMESSGNVLRRYVWPACDALGLPRATWLTFRRTFSTVLHTEGVAAKTIAEMMGHADVSTQFIYIQGDDEMSRVAAGKIGDAVSRFCPDDDQMSLRFVN